MLARVSHIESFRRWRLDDEKDVADLVADLTRDEPTERMLAGTAFHKALELAEPGQYETLTALGYTFNIEGVGTVSVPQAREVRAFGRYGDLTVTGQTDGLNGKVIVDHKTTSSFDAESYLGGYQWRFYLDLFEADVFRWQVFELLQYTDDPEKFYRVTGPHHLAAYRYPALRRDCELMAADFLAFAREHLPPDYARISA